MDAPSNGRNKLHTHPPTDGKKKRMIDKPIDFSFPNVNPIYLKEA